MRRKRPRGYRYTVGTEQLRRYGQWPVERRLAWLYLGNKLRKQLPRKTIEIQDSFRRF